MAAISFADRNLSSLARCSVSSQASRSIRRECDVFYAKHNAFRLDNPECGLFVAGRVDQENLLLKKQGWRSRQLIDGYIRYLRDQKNSKGSSSVRETSPAYDGSDGLDDDSRFSI